jgi:hypothetical protein
MKFEPSDEEDEVAQFKGLRKTPEEKVEIFQLL